MTSAFSMRSGSGEFSIPTSRTSTSECSWLTSSWSVCRLLGGHCAVLTPTLALVHWQRIITLCSRRRELIACSAVDDRTAESPPDTFARSAACIYASAPASLLIMHDSLRPSMHTCNNYCSIVFCSRDPCAGKDWAPIGAQPALNGYRLVIF